MIETSGMVVGGGWVVGFGAQVVAVSVLVAVPVVWWRKRKRT